jgi:PKD repeat protein
MVQKFVTNNIDPTYHGVYRDYGSSGNTCTGDDQILGASGPQGNSAFENTDEAASASAKHLFYQRTIYYEAPGQADGPARLAEEQQGLELAAAPIALRAAPANQAPTASFDVSPASPRPGKPVTFTSTSGDADGTIASHEWDLDGDGAFDDASGPRATRAYDTGAYSVSLRVTDDDGASSQATRSIRVCPERGGPRGVCKG